MVNRPAFDSVEIPRAAALDHGLAGEAAEDERTADYQRAHRQPLPAGRGRRDIVSRRRLIEVEESACGRGECGNCCTT